MNAATTRLTRLSLSVAAVGAAVTLACAPAVAAGSGVDVTNTETVQIYTDATGKVSQSRVYEQLTLSGKGTVELDNPTAKSGVRNLDGFGGADAEDGTQHVSTTVDGERRLRTVSDFEGQAPLTLSVAYELDGKKVQPGDVVGKTGRLQVTYTVKNTSAVEQEVTFDDGRGGTITRTVEVPIPIVGSLTTVAPPSFANVTSEQANMAGDGKGGTKLSFTMTLIPPIGSDTATFGYAADITDGVIPRADMSALPVDPLQSPSFKTAATSYQGGAETGTKLTGGAVEIDANLLKLRDGAGDLLSGLLQLQEGATKLSDGLSETAAPGSEKLADGATSLDEGLGKLDDGGKKLAAGTGTLEAGAGDLDAGAGKLDAGAGKLAAGSDDLSAGTTKALNGSKDLTTGLKKISDGLGQLGDKNAGLPAAAGGIEKLKAGVDQLSAGLGQPDQPKTMIGGLTGLSAGLGQLKAGASALEGGVADGKPFGLLAAKLGVGQVRDGLSGSLADKSIPTLQGAASSLLQNAACSADAECKTTAGTLAGGLGQYETARKAKLETAIGGLDQIATGLTNAIGGANTLASKLGEAQTGAGTLLEGSKALKGGTTQVRSGLDDLAKGVTNAVNGVLQLGAGANTAYTGSSTLSGGLGQLDAGAGKLAAGADDLSAGTGKLEAGTSKLADGSQDLAAGADKLSDGLGTARDGSGKLAAGADKLADGLDTAADGSGKIADGLTKAADGAPQLVDGAQRLSDEGTKQLVGAGEDTAQNYGEMYATLEAGAERANTDDMVFGAPEGAQGLTAYSYVIQGEDGDSGRNLTRGLAGLALLGAGGGVVALRRRIA